MVYARSMTLYVTRCSNGPRLGCVLTTRGWRMHTNTRPLPERRLRVTDRIGSAVGSANLMQETTLQPRLY